MSLSFKLDSNNNIVHNSSFIVVSGLEALVQDIKNMLYMYKGEYPYNNSKGIDYINYMQNNDEVGLLSAIQKRILEDKRVINATFDKAKENGKLKIVLTVKNNMEVSFELD